MIYKSKHTEKGFIRVQDLRIEFKDYTLEIPNEYDKFMIHNDNFEVIEIPKSDKKKVKK